MRSPRAVVLVRLLPALALVLGACSDGTSPPLPGGPGTPLPLCSADVTCAAGSSCIIASKERGHCVPDGIGGGRCRPATDARGACDPGLACAGKDDTCVPVVALGATCVASACPADATCGSLTGVPRCARDGADGGRCRDGAVACDAGLGCTPQGRCAPLRTDNLCISGGRAYGCPDGLICPRRASTGARDTTCVQPGSGSRPCRRTQPRCDEGLGCFNGVCEAAVSLVGGSCFGTGIHGRCEEGASCLDMVCLPNGIEGGLCRTNVPRAQACDPGLSCYRDTCRKPFAVDAACDPISPETAFCPQGTSCLVTAADVPPRCAVDGTPGAACRRVTEADAGCDAPYVCSDVRSGGRRCVIPIPAGAPCSREREPFEPCEAGTACSLGQGACVPLGTRGGRCRERGACDAGLVCLAAPGGARYCVPAPPEAAVGQPCDDQTDELRRRDRCVAGATCVRGTCRAAGSDGAPCRPPSSDRGPCDAGLACPFGTCQAGPAVGGECSDGAGCAWPALCVRPPTSSNGTCAAIPAYAATPIAAAEVPDGCEGGEELSFGALSGDDPRDDGETRLELPFQFPFYGGWYRELGVRLDGIVGFPSVSETFNPGRGGAGMLPAPTVAPVIAAFWDDLVLGDAGKGGARVCARKFAARAADGSDARLVLEWRGMRRFGRASVDLGFALALYANGTIEIAHRRLRAATADDAPWASGVRASIGMQSGGGWASWISAAALGEGKGVRISGAPTTPKPVPKPDDVDAGVDASVPSGGVDAGVANDAGAAPAL